MPQQPHGRPQRPPAGDSGAGALTRIRRISKKNVQRLARTMNGAAWAVAAAAFFVPPLFRPAAIVALLLPWAAVALAYRFQGTLGIDRRQKKADPNPDTAFAMPGFVLCLGFQYYHPLSWWRLLILGSLVGAALSAATAVADNSIRKWKLAVVYILTLCYGVGSLLVLNAFLDGSSPVQYQTAVLEKHISSAPRGGTSYQLTLESWGRWRTKDRFDVSRALYDAVKIGDSVCPSVNRGALGIPWYRVASCD